QAFPRIQDARLDVWTLAFTTVVALLTGVLFGIVPALHSTRLGSRHGVTENDRRSTSGAERQRLRKLLIGSQVALGPILLAAAGVLVRSFARLLQVEPGFKPDGLLTLRLALPPASYPTPQRIAQFYRELDRRLQELPGVDAVGAISGLPLAGRGGPGSATVCSKGRSARPTCPE